MKMTRSGGGTAFRYERVVVVRDREPLMTLQEDLRISLHRSDMGSSGESKPAWGSIGENGANIEKIVKFG